MWCHLTRWRSAGIVAAVLAGSAVGAGCSSPHEYAAARIDPPPVVDEQALPDLTNGGQPRSLVAEPGELLLVYFGYTNCPDFCPQSMSDAAAARNRLDDPTRVQVAMVTIDPDRDLDHLATYVQSFFDDGIALGTDDPAALARAAAPFGVSYVVTKDTVPPGDEAAAERSPSTEPTVSVSHTTSLFAVDDRGRLVMTWSYGTAISDIAADIEAYLNDEMGG